MHLHSVSRFKKSILAALIVSISCAMASPVVLAQNQASDMAGTTDQARLVSAAAQRDFAEFVQFNVQRRGGTLPSEFPLEVNDVQDLKDAKIGYGFPVYSLPPQDVMNGRGDLRSMAKATGEWRFVITLHDNPIGLATLRQTNGRWGVTSYGGAVLAKDVDAAVAMHGNSTRSNLRFIRVYQAMSDFLEVVSPTDARARFAPLHAARQNLLLQQRSEKTGTASTSNGLLDQSDILDPLRVSVKRNIENFR
ncbi:hypothetical protein [Undibacterium pigrum]|uniref:Uncharacterized protein n=1 Tax=Undibacterium pigrum TaxID=401470 RepID=A0A318IU16_9BURK|nr:hypothetical protein [Undibacterium pigrum]PXX37901.1 hypothetical protein DFR42_11460 [Undibacterium pigrum]